MSAKQPKENLKAYMGINSVFQGTLNFQGTVRIDGKFKGKVVTDDTLIIGETGELNAEITAGTVICKGKVKGVIQATKRIEIHAKSELVGNIKTPSLYVEVGAVFDGNCDMIPGKRKIIKLAKNEEKKSQTPA
ncbi:MAG: polymer-forming cytoskeletal protein [Nitrospinales bacterium]